MENYNGRYEAFYWIIVKSNNHKDCLSTYNRFKSLVAAFNFGNITIHESKSARKGDVLSRDIQIIFIGHATDVLTFREALDRIIFINNIFPQGTIATLDRSEMSRENAHRDLIKQTS